jgi:hypothetical protein
LCLAIVGPAQVRNHLLEGMCTAALHHTEMAGEHTMLRVARSPTTELVLGRLPDETFQVQVMDELVSEFQRLEELWPRLERTGMRIFDLRLGPPLGWA